MTSSSPGKATIYLCSSESHRDSRGWISPTGNVTRSSNAVKDFPLSMRAATYTSLFGKFDPKSYTEDLVVCSTGTCSWDPFATLGVSAECTNAGVEKGPGDVQFIPGGTTNKFQNTSFVVTPYSSVPNLPSNSSDFLRFSSIYRGEQENIGMDCTLRFCVHVVNSTIVNGTLSDTVLESHCDSRLQANESPPTANSSRLNVFASSLAPQYILSPMFIDSINLEWYSVYFKGLLLGSMGPSTPVPLEIVLALQKNNSLDIPARMNDLASALSRELRQSCSGRTEVAGKALTAVSIVHIRWRWMVLPMVMEVLGIVFFVAILVVGKRSQARLWKTSSLAALFHGVVLEGGEEEVEVEVETIWDMEWKAKRMWVRLESEGIGVARLVKVDGEG